MKQDEELTNEHYYHTIDMNWVTGEWDNGRIYAGKKHYIYGILLELENETHYKN